MSSSYLSRISEIRILPYWLEIYGQENLTGFDNSSFAFAHLHISGQCSYFQPHEIIRKGFLVFSTGIKWENWPELG